jgi:uncharacterized protein involved in exopolysaccharide biosynthesis
MNPNTTDNKTISADEISLREVVVKIKSGSRHLKSKWLIILITGIIGAAIGVAYSVMKKPIYTADCTFVLDSDSKSGSLGQYAGLMALAGIDLGGGSQSGLYDGDNIIELYKSRLMIEKALLSADEFNGKKELLIDRYIDFNKLREKWKSKSNLANINFAGDPEKFNRTQDSIINNLVQTFNKQVLTVSRPDKKLSIINVEVVSEDELFAKEFTNVLVQTVNNFYIIAKTKKASQNVLILQKQADSVRLVLNSSISGVASALDASPNANPLLQSLKVPSQKRQVDVQASSAIYSEVVKNLEVSKMLLRQETPLIQIIDAPVLPLAKSKLSKAKAGTIGLIFGILICSLLLIVKTLF